MFYTLCEDVYIVHGKSKSCIYDLKNSRLYSVNKLLADKIDDINKGILTEDNIDEKLKKVIENLIEKNIISKSISHQLNNISDLKIKNENIQFAWIEITNKCNLRCIHCYNESDNKSTHNMSIDDFCKIIDLLEEQRVSRIQIIGGEPFCNRLELKKMLDYVSGKFDFIEIFTNGTLIDDSWYPVFKDKNINIALSVYSYEKEYHEQVTGIVDSLNKTNNTIKNLKKYKIPYRVCNVLMNGIDIGNKNTELYTLNEERDVVRMSGRANFKLLSDNLIKKKLITKKTFSKKINKYFCQSLISGHNCFSNKIYIAADLTIYPCVMERRLCHGKITNKIELNHEIQKFTKDKINGCCKCEYRYACYDCRPNSLSGDIFEKPWYCTYDPTTGVWANEDEFIDKLKSIWG